MKYLLLILALCSVALADVTVTFPAGSPVKITASASGTKPFNYEWYKDDERIAGAASDTISIPSVTQAHAGVYRAIVMNSAGQTNTDRGTLVVSAVIAAPVFTTDPASQTVAVGATVTFSALASNNPTYQWMKNGQPISGATAASYSIPSVSTGHIGVYTVVAKNAGGSTTSKSATLSVTTLPVVVPPGSGTISITFGP